MPLPQGNETASTWMTTEIPSTEPLTDNIEVDVCVVMTIIILNYRKFMEQMELNSSQTV